MRTPVPVTVDSRLRLPPGLPRDLVQELRGLFRYSNPEFHKKQRMGHSTFGVERTVSSWREDPDGGLSLPRGGLRRMREALEKRGYAAVVKDRRVSLPEVEWPELEVELHWYQQEAHGLCLKVQQGIVRAPTGSGKSVLALAVAASTKQPTLVIMRDSNLLEQWKSEAEDKLGMDPKEIGLLTGARKLRIGARLTLGLQQTLSSPAFPWAEVTPYIGCVMVDEAHTAASKTFQVAIESIPAKYRLGFTADESRKDKREWLLYDSFGEVLYTIPREALEEEGFVVPVRVRLVPTHFEADWYRDAPMGEKNFGQLLDAMVRDEAREQQLVELVKWLARSEQVPLFVFSQRKEHAAQLADRKLFAEGLRSGLMLGGAQHKVRFRDDKARLKAGKLPVAVGTYQALGTGHNVPQLRAALMALPIGDNRQFFNQVRGRVCRAFPGKEEGLLYVLWDRRVFPEAPRRFSSWNGGLVEVLGEGGRWELVE